MYLDAPARIFSLPVGIDQYVGKRIVDFPEFSVILLGIIRIRITVDMAQHI